jgi:hypothetical protein
MTRLEIVTVSVLDDGCFSVLLWDKRPFAVSVERTFENGRIVIGNGIYRCTRDFYHKGGYETFEIQVDGHDRVLFHKGNTEADSTACVIVANSFGELHDKTAVMDSKTGFEKFMKLTAGLENFLVWAHGR